MAGEGLAKLVDLMAHLRGPDGCPWDREQDYDSVKPLLLEEAYEVIDAVNSRDFDGLEDELGDLLFQVVFYSRLAEEEQRFKLDDVIERLHAKLVRRHPHVFGEARAKTAAEALKSWLSVKESEGAGTGSGTESLLEGISASLPATLEAYEIGLRAAEVGFDWVKIEDLIDKVEEEVHELRHEIASRLPENGRLEEEAGDLLFAASNLARYLGSDPESCLRRANQKFKRRFQALEQEVAKMGKKVRECPLEDLERIWNEVKREEKEPGATRL